MMLQVSSNPEPILPVSTPRSERSDTSEPSIWPQLGKESRHPSLLAQIKSLKEAGDVNSMVALYEAYADMARAIQAIENQPRAERVEMFLSKEFEAAMYKAEIVVFHLVQMKIDTELSPLAATVIMDCATKVGMGVNKAMAIIRAIRIGGAE